MGPANPFLSDAMALGYATARPAVHPRIIERLRAHLPPLPPKARVLDLGCGAGLSTAPLSSVATHVTGLEPVLAMLTRAPALAPGASFVAGRAEALPFRAASFHLITAAGSLNFVDLVRFFPEASRVLAPGGLLAVYDFYPGRSFPDSPALEDWFLAFISRYPPPPGEAVELNPEILARIHAAFRLNSHESFEVALTLAPDFYLDYVMTETNVAHAIRHGVPAASIRSWCATTLAPVFSDREREVLFRGYLACLEPV